MTTKVKITCFLMTAVLALSVPLVYAENGNGGNLPGGQTAGSTGQASSDQGEHGWKQGHWNRHGHHMDGKSCHKLNLTDDQKKQMKGIWQKQKEAMKANFEQMKTNREALDQELANTNPDMNKISQIQTQIKALQALMVDNRLNSTLEVKKILTPEQFGKYLESQKHKFGGRFHKGEGDRNGRNYKHDRSSKNHCYRGHWNAEGDDN